MSAGEIRTAGAGREKGELLTRREVSDNLRHLGFRMKPATLARAWSVGAGGSPCRHVRGKPYYPKALRLAWLESQTTCLRRSAGEAGEYGDGGPPR